MLKVIRSQGRIRAETATAVLEWDLQKGGQLVGCEFKGFHGERRPVMTGGEAAPNMRLDLGDRVITVADVPVSDVQVVRDDPGAFIFTTQARLDDTWTVTQRYEIFEEGAMFCELSLVIDKGRTVRVRNAELRVPLDVLAVKNMRLNYVTRDVYLKQDVTCCHVLPVMMISRERNERVDVPHLVPMFGLDLGWEESRYFSNKLEVILEDSTSMGGERLNPTRTTVVEEAGKMQLRWIVCENGSEELAGGFQYRNKWGLFFGAARSEAGKKADAARRNNVLGSRVCHVMYPYVRAGKEWPWCSIPIKQVWYQDAQMAKESPSLKRVDEAARLGCNVLIIHQFWMRNGGSNGEPAADYTVFDPKWFKAFVKRAHDRGMRVAVYMRGTENYSLYMDFFEKYLKKDWDGLYIDWATPFGLGFTKATNKHNSIHNWFMFTRALRQRVGAGGIMIGHGAIQTHVSYACFDATLTGEFSVMHSGLLASPEFSASYSGFASCGVHLMAGNAPDRIAFSSQRAAGLSAGLGYQNHPFMEPNKPFDACSEYIQPLWNLFNALGGAPVRSYNASVGTGLGTRASDAALHPIVYQAADGATLVVVTNLSDAAVSGTVEIDLAALGLKAGSELKPLQVAGTHVPQVDGARIVLKDIPSYFFGGVLIAARRARPAVKPAKAAKKAKASKAAKSAKARKGRK